MRSWMISSQAIHTLLLRDAVMMSNHEGLVEQPVRTRSVDILRGIVMVIMALDHVRDFFSITPFAPDDAAATTPLWLPRAG